MWVADPLQHDHPVMPERPALTHMPWCSACQLEEFRATLTPEQLAEEERLSVPSPRVSRRRGG